MSQNEVEEQALPRLEKEDAKVLHAFLTKHYGDLEIFCSYRSDGANADMLIADVHKVAYPKQPMPNLHKTEEDNAADLV